MWTERGFSKNQFLFLYVLQFYILKKSSKWKIYLVSGKLCHKILSPQMLPFFWFPNDVLWSEMHAKKIFRFFFLLRRKDFRLEFLVIGDCFENLIFFFFAKQRKGFGQMRMRDHLDWKPTCLAWHSWTWLQSWNYPCDYLPQRAWETIQYPCFWLLASETMGDYLCFWLFVAGRVRDCLCMVVYRVFQNTFMRLIYQ